MGKTVKVPKPVYDEIKAQADRDDVAMGVVIRDWKEKAELVESVGVEQ